MNKLIIGGKEIELSQETVDNLKKVLGVKEEKILVPDSIKIKKYSGSCDILGIAFNNNKQILYYSGGLYKVDSSTELYFIQCELIPVKKEDRKVGYTYYRTDLKDIDFLSKISYCRYLGDDEYVYTSGKNILVNDLNFKYWYQVVPLRK